MDNSSEQTTNMYYGIECEYTDHAGLIVDKNVL